MADFSLWGAFKLFDAYTIRARILPALIAGLPSISLPFVLVPWSHLGISNVVFSTMSFVLLYAFADFARRGGYSVEERLGTRSTPELWHRSNNELPNGTKDQFRSFVSTKIKQQAPTEIDEIERTSLANDFYNSAASWLREHTRDKKVFNILFDELMTYGFRRNLLGLKIPALCMNLIVLVLSSAILYFRLPYFDKIIYIDEKLVAVLSVVLLHSAYMLLAVNANGVRDASKIYGKQLIFSCATLMKPATQTRKKNVAE